MEGEPIPLVIQAHDGNSELNIDCVLMDISAQKEYFRVKMSHLSGGLYVNKDVNMPRTGIITAQYCINSEEYSSTIDIYEPIKKVEPESAFCNLFF